MFDMRLKYFFVILAITLWACVPNRPSETVPAPPQPVPVPAALKPDTSVTFGQLPNGFRYVFRHNTTPRDRVSMHLNIQAGSFEETDEQQGLAHFLEHMVFNGSTHFKPGEMVKYFQNIGMEFGPDANAHTGFYSTGYDILLPEGDTESLDKGLVVLQDYAEGALLLPEETDRERKIILAEKRSRDSAGYRTLLATLNFEIPDMRISRRLPIGQEKIIRNANRKLLKDFYDTWYRPERMTLVMVGDFSPETALPLIEKRFGSMQARAPARPEPDEGNIRHEGIKAFYHYEKEAGNTDVTIQVLEKAEPEPDSFENRKKELVESIAAQIVQNRLERMLRKPDPVFTNAEAGSGIFLKYIRYGMISAECNPENREKTLMVLEQTLRRALTYGFTNAEIERVKKDFLAGLDRAVQNAATRESTDIANRIISSINLDEVFMSPEQERDMFAPVIRALTPDQLHAAFREIWSPDHRMVMITGNAEITGTSPESEILAAFDASSKVAVTPPEQTRIARFPYLDPPASLGKIVRKNEIRDLGIVQVDFENGLRLNIRKTDFEANSVVAALAFGKGRSSEPADKNGLAVITESFLNESGLGHLTQDELNRALAGKNTAIRFDAGEGDFYFRGETVPDEAELLFQLLYASLTDPGFHPDSWQLVRERFSQGYRHLSRSIEGAMPLSGSRFLAGGDTRFGMPGREQFERLTLDDVRTWISEPLKNAPLELSVVGDIDPEKVIDLTARYLGALPPRQPDVSKQEKPLRFPAGKSLDIQVNTRIQKGEVRVVLPSEDIWDIGRSRRLSALASVFSDRLREVIREKLGATYSPYAYNAPSYTYPGYGLFQAVISVNPADANQVVEAVKSIITDLGQNGVTAEELKRAIDPTLTGIKDLQQQNSYWLNTVLTGSREHPRQIEWSRTIAQDYKSITPAELSEMARRYMNTDQAAVIIVTPDQKAASGEDGSEKS